MTFADLCLFVLVDGPYYAAHGRALHAKPVCQHAACTVAERRHDANASGPTIERYIQTVENTIIRGLAKHALVLSTLRKGVLALDDTE